MQAQTLKGFRDYLPPLMAPRAQMIRTIEQTFEVHGFVPLQTPALEYLETLAHKSGAEADKLLYHFLDHGQRAVALRYDLTVPLARVVAEHRGALQLPFRRYQVAPVWRADKPQRGRFREFVQCDVDICGVDRAVADAEVLIAGLAVLRALGIAQATLHLNHRDVLFGMLALHGVADPGHQTACIRAIDKLDKAPVPVVVAEIVAHTGADQAQTEALIAAFQTATLPQLLDQAERAQAAPLHAALQRIGQVQALVTAAGFGDQLRFDCTIARGLDYYTGVIYETRLTDPKVAAMGAVMSGGRYDGLIESFSREKVPAVGISVGLDRLLAALQELGLVAADLASVPIYVTVMSPDVAGAALALAQEVRAAGLRCEVDLAGGKLGKQFERAAKRGAKLVLVLGPDELAAGTVVVKDLRNGTQQAVGRAEMVAELRRGVDAG